MMQAYKWLALKRCVLLMVHFLTVEALSLAVTPADNACPGEDMTFMCQKTSNDGTAVSNVRWTLTRDRIEVIPQLTLTQGSGCPCLHRNYNNLPITMTLYNSYSTLNVTADSQLQGLMVECLLVSSTVERETIPIQITQPPSSPSNARITSIHNGNYSTTVELAWDFNRLNNATHFSVRISSNGETWFSRAIIEDQKVSITLSYNIDYTLDVMTVNCAGHSEVSRVSDIFLANCSAPITTNAGVVVEPYNNTVEGAVIYFNCGSGFHPNERRMAVCQRNGQWSPKISNLTCEQLQGTEDQTLQTLLMKEEFLFQCEKNSGAFLSVCKGEALTLNCSSCENYAAAAESGFAYGRIEGLVGFTVASFILGMICGALFLLLPYLFKKRCETINKKKIELSQNMAYETIPFPSKSIFQEKAMIK